MADLLQNLQVDPQVNMRDNLEVRFLLDVLVFDNNDIIFIHIIMLFIGATKPKFEHPRRVGSLGNSYS